MVEGRVAFIATRWHDRQSELAYVTRSLAAAASRWSDVSVLVPGNRPSQPDGAFDLRGAGPDGVAGWIHELSPGTSIVVDEVTADVSTLLSKVDPRSVFSVSALQPGHDPSWRQLALTPAEKSGEAFVSVYVPVNRQAQLHRHNGFGFTGYQLVLAGRSENRDDPPAAAAWLTAAFPAADVIVVEEGVAFAWRGRALRGTATVDTRMDLWRLIAHANVCVDLAPGRYIARECVEALRYGTPIVVPEGSGPAVAHTRAGAGATFKDPEELLAAAGPLRSLGVRSAISRRGQEYADRSFGDPWSSPEKLRAVLSTATRS